MGKINIAWATGPWLRCFPEFDRLSQLGLVLAFGASWCIALEGWAAAALFLLGSAGCDVLDGALARLRGGVRPEAAFSDAVLDRVGEIVVFCGLACALPTRASGLLMTAALGASLLVSYTRARGEGLGQQCPRGGFERPVRLMLLVAAMFAAAFVTPSYTVWVMNTALGIIAVGAIVTAMGRGFTLHRRLGRLSCGEYIRPSVVTEKAPATCVSAWSHPTI